MVLSCLAPRCITDLRALPDEFLYCVDASPSEAGICRSRIGKRGPGSCGDVGISRGIGCLFLVVWLLR